VSSAWGQFFPGHIISTWQDYEVLYMVDPLDEICSQSIVDYEAMGVDAALDSSSVIVGCFGRWDMI